MAGFRRGLRNAARAAGRYTYDIQEIAMGWSNNHPNGLIHYEPRDAFRGYTLITNVSGHDARLIDMEGRICHTWHSDEGIGYSYLLVGVRRSLDTPQSRSARCLRGRISGEERRRQR